MICLTYSPENEKSPNLKKGTILKMSKISFHSRDDSVNTYFRLFITKMICLKKTKFLNELMKPQNVK